MLVVLQELGLVITGTLPVFNKTKNSQGKAKVLFCGTFVFSVNSCLSYESDELKRNQICFQKSWLSIAGPEPVDSGGDGHRRVSGRHQETDSSFHCKA